MLINHKITNQKSEDFTVLDIGHEKDASKKAFGPKPRFRYIIHFVVKGILTFNPNQDKNYEIHENQAFLIKPNENTYYKAKDDSNVEYYWIGIMGDVDKILSYIGFIDECPVIDLEQPNLLIDAFERFYKEENINQVSENICFYNLVEAFRLSSKKNDRLIEDNLQDQYIKKSIAYMEYNVNSKISIKDISSYLGIDRTYFSKLFKEKTNYSPYDYFSKLKIEKAKVLLSTTKMNIGMIADSLGYNDIYVFSKVFKKNTNLSPKEYRNKE